MSSATQRVAFLGGAPGAPTVTGPVGRVELGVELGQPAPVRGPAAGSSSAGSADGPRRPGPPPARSSAVTSYPGFARSARR